MKLRERLGKEWLFFDGGTGTLLQAQGLAGGEKPETWNLLHPEIIRALHRRYLDAGADILITNTFGANRFHYGEELPGIIRAAVSLARQARKEACREDDAYIALDLGPSGKLLKPLGTLPFEDAVQAFAEIVKTGADAGADLVLIETMNDAFEAKAALLAAKESCDLPVFATCTFDGSGKLLTGGTPSSLIPMLEGLGADAVGINCSLGPEEMLPLVREIVSLTSLPVIVSPNAGLPDVQGGRTVYPVGPKRFALCMKEIASAGAHVLGGCCGTTPEHIRLMKEAVSPLPFQPPVRKSRLIVSSGAAFAEIGGTPLMIGERINPSGKKRFKQALQDHDLDYVLTQALEQEDAGADILDVNTGLPGIDEAAVMEDVITALQSVTVLPLCIDSADPAVLARTLRVYNGRPLINSVNGKEESMQAVFPLAKKYGAAVIALCLDENGIPETAEGRLAVAEKIIRRAEEYGIGRSRLIFDGLTLTISAVPDSALITLETVRALREKLHLKTVLGLSNISFGLPQRSQVNAAFLTMALQNGLSLAIMNPNDEAMRGAFYAAGALLAHDRQGIAYIEAFRTKAPEAAAQPPAADLPASSGPSSALLKTAILRGLISAAEKETAALLAEGAEPLSLIDEVFVPALNEVGAAYESGRLFLPQLLMSADAAKAGFALLQRALPESGQAKKGKILLATVKGDIHDIGKNIVKVLLENYAYDVIDLGKDVAPERIVSETLRQHIPLVGLSALMTTTVPSMEETIRQLRAAAPQVKIMVGGAVLTQDYADRIGADAYGKDAMAAVRYAESVFSNETD